MNRYYFHYSPPGTVVTLCIYTKCCTIATWYTVSHLGLMLLLLYSEYRAVNRCWVLSRLVSRASFEFPNDRNSSFRFKPHALCRPIGNTRRTYQVYTTVYEQYHHSRSTNHNEQQQKQRNITYTQRDGFLSLKEYLLTCQMMSAPGHQRRAQHHKQCQPDAERADTYRRTGSVVFVAAV